MKSCAYHVLLMLTITTSVYGNAWVARYNGPGSADDDVVAIALDGSNNVFVAGSTFSNDSSYDYTTVKYDPNGNLLWEMRYNGPDNRSDFAKAMAIDGSGNVYVTGGSLSDSNGMDYATVKYDPCGIQLWASRYNYTDNDFDQASDITVDNSGNVYVTGGSFSYVNGQDYATVKYNSSGTQLWASRYDGTAHLWDMATAIGIDGSGNVYVTGMSNDGNYVNDYATVRYWTSDGSQHWVQRYNGPGDSDDSAYDLVVDSSGSVYVTGCSFGATSYDYATIKYNSSGTQLWTPAARYNGPSDGYDEARAIALDTSGNVYVTGYCWDESTSTDYETIKYDSGGTQLWEARYNGPGNSNDDAWSLAVDGSGNVYVTGGSYANDIISDDYATVKYNSSGVEQWSARYNGRGHNNDVAVDIVLDASGNVYVTGKSVGPGTGADFLTIKNPNEVGYCLGPMASDLDSDCKVDFADFALFVLEWLHCNYDQPEFCW
ncbi:MAG: SBBP repeat-containing protein [Sedimentisphaerales bacterium]|nr:SBBP repeat-containing protein [Sedimentisphaerales bacterium]